MIREYYLQYHQNCYFLELNQSLLKRVSDEKLRSKVLTRHFEYLKQKHEIDLLLNRKEEIKKNICQFKLYSQSIEEIDPGFSVTNFIKDTISHVNNPRLDHAVWSRNLAEVMIIFLGVIAPELSRLLALISLVNGFSSYGFYVIRGGIDFVVGGSHVIDTSLENHGITLSDRINFQSEQRYYRVINDIALWAPVNFATFHYLYGAGFWGLFGTGLTVALLIGDALLNYVVYRHKQAQFDKIYESLSDEEYKENLKKIHEEQQEKLFYTIIYQVLLVASFSLFLMNTLPYILAGSIVICVLQLLLKEKDLYLDFLKTNSGSNEATIIQVKMLINLIEYLTIPSIFLVAGMVVMPMLPTVSPILIFLVCCAASVMVINASADLSKLVEESYSNKQLPSL